MTSCVAPRSRGQPLELDLLSQLLSQHKPRDISSTLTSLPDYLGLPGCPSDYLPAEDQIPLQHAGVLDLHVCPLASTAAQQIMASLPFRRHGPAPSGLRRLAGTQPRAALYLLCCRAVDSRSLASADERQQLEGAGHSYTEVVEVYQVHMPLGAQGPWPPLPLCSLPECDVPSSCCIMDVNSPIELLSAPTLQGTASLTSMGALFGERATTGLDRQTALGRCAAAELEEALSKVAVQGHTGGAAARVHSSMGTSQLQQELQLHLLPSVDYHLVIAAQLSGALTLSVAAVASVKVWYV